MKETEDKHTEFEEILTRKLAGAEIAPPANMWSRIENKRGKNRYLLLRIAAISLLLLGSGLLITLMTRESTREIVSRSNSQIELNQVSKTEQLSEETQTTQSAESFTAQAAVLALSEPVSQSSNNSSYIEEQDVHQTDVLNTSGQETIEILPLDDTTDEPEKRTEPESKKLIPVPEQIFDETPPIKKNDRKLRLGLAYGSNINRGPDAEAAPQKLSSSQFGFDEFQGELAYETVFFQQIENTNFEVPFSVGLLLNLPITQRLRLETGLQYTLLAHESRTKVMNNKHSVYNTKLHYLGIPVGLQWVIINGRLLRFYVSQSLIIEKGLSANYSADRYEKGRFLETESSQVEIRGIQLSSNSSVGIEIAIQKSLALFGQAGAQVFLMNKTQPFNLRSEHMIWPSVQTGIRWRIHE